MKPTSYLWTGATLAVIGVGLFLLVNSDDELQDAINEAGGDAGTDTLGNIAAGGLLAAAAVFLLIGAVAIGMRASKSD